MKPARKSRFLKIFTLWALFTFHQTVAYSVKVPKGGTLYTVVRDTPIRYTASAVADVLETIPDAGTKVLWIEADAKNPRWQKIKIQESTRSIEGYVAESNLAIEDPTKASPVWAQTKNGGRVTAGIVVATAATRAFMDFDPISHQYAKSTSDMEVIAWLAKVSILEQSVKPQQ